MKKLFLTLTVSVAIVCSAFAQSTTSTSSSEKGGVKFSIGAEGGLPIGDASDVYSAVIGGSLKCEIPISPTAFVTINGGYNAFLIKSEFKDAGSPSSTSFIPVKAGIKYYSAGGFFLEGQAGVVFIAESGGGNSFAWSAGFGYTFGGGIETGVRYEAWSNGGTIGQMGLRLAYRF
ncbi:MAG TPA: hypothetical protein VIM16_15320 [Mucilaginibacter sp.]